VGLDLNVATVRSSGTSKINVLKYLGIHQISIIYAQIPPLHPGIKARIDFSTLEIEFGNEKEEDQNLAIGGILHTGRIENRASKPSFW